jgi:tetratricopeptide (TPR) repeat protein
MTMNDFRPAKPEHRWYQFILQTLLVFVALCVSACSWLKGGDPAMRCRSKCFAPAAMPAVVLLGSLLLAALLQSPVRAVFALEDTENVPAERLIANLEKRLASKPKESAQIRSGEEIQIWTWLHKHLDGVYVVDDEGLIKLPGIEPWKVSGKTLSQVRKELNGRVNPRELRDGKIGVEQSWQQRNGRVLPGELAELHYELARLHAMSSSRKIGEFRALKGGERPFFGHEPYNRFPPDFQRHRKRRQYDKPNEEEARKHFAAAITHYGEAVRLRKDHLPAQLGLGWCLDQAGNKTAAVEVYRQALALAWKEEEKRDSIYSGGSFVDETSRYLLALLDPAEDGEEIEKIKRYQAAISKKGRVITPLLIPLIDDVPFAQLVDISADVPFDLDGSGLQRRWGWIKPKAAWLVWDPVGSGEITSGLQMFGNVTFWVFWENGYEALSALDDDGDGVLSGHELKGLALWRDANSNGVSDRGEVQTVNAWGIESLSCHQYEHSTGIVFSPRGVVFKDGATRPTYDWIAPSR